MHSFAAWVVSEQSLTHGYMHASHDSQLVPVKSKLKQINNKKAPYDTDWLRHMYLSSVAIKILT